MRTGPEEILVTPESATRGLYGSTSTSIFAINENHSDMVKFREGDPNWGVVVGKLREICKIHQEAVGSNRPSKRRRLSYTRLRHLEDWEDSEDSEDSEYRDFSRMSQSSLKASNTLVGK
jgi:hypothetical protein